MSGAAAPTTRAIRCRSYLLSRPTPLCILYVISRTRGAILIGWGCQSVLSASCKVAACHRNASNERKTRPEYIPSCNRARGTKSGVWVGLLSLAGLIRSACLPAFCSHSLLWRAFIIRSPRITSRVALSMFLGLHGGPPLMGGALAFNPVEPSMLQRLASNIVQVRCPSLPASSQVSHSRVHKKGVAMIRNSNTFFSGGRLI